MKQTRLILTGGFLGAGKTTLIWDAAKRLIAQGKRVALITNDQAPELVDTTWLRADGLKVGEVAGSCFCCNFNGFVAAIQQMRQEAEADVIIAEPVGSCADLAATIVNPLKKFHNTELLVSPLTVLADPQRVASILQGKSAGLHDDAAYIYHKQLEESDIILLTKTDLLSATEVARLTEALQKEFPSSKVMTASVVNGTGIDEWIAEASSRENGGQRLLTIDYDRYAHGEAMLGWLNGTVEIGCATSCAKEGAEGTTAVEAVDWDEFFKSLVGSIAHRIAEEKLPVGHVKLMAFCGDDNMIANITGDVSTLSMRGTLGKADSVTLIINARVETSPEHLDELMRSVLDEQTANGFTQEVKAWRFLQPGRPNPTHRFVEVV